jgi:stage IV sporulation protein FB
MSFEERQFQNLAVRAGTIRGIEIRIHGFLILAIAVNLLNNLWRAVPYGVQHWLVSSATLVISILLHELGHCYAAFRQGGGADKIILWPLGGLALCDAPNDPRSQFFVALGGPLASAALLAVWATVGLVAGWPLLPVRGADTFPAMQVIAQYFVLGNAIILGLNLLPCYPLDGGRMLQAYLASRFESSAQASLVTLRLGQVTAVFCLVTGLLIAGFGLFDPAFFLQKPFLSELSPGLILVALIHYVEGRALQHRILSGEEDEGGIFGYDFSRGYTSLERTSPREKRKEPFAQRLRASFRERTGRRRREETAHMKERVDELLEKISREGMDSLTRREQKFLRKASRALKKG